MDYESKNDWTITLLILLCMSLLIDGSNQQELNTLNSFTASTMLLPETRQLIEQNRIALSDGTLVKPAPVFQTSGMRRSDGVMETREVYLKMGADGAHSIFIKHYAIVPETIQLKDYRKKRRKLSENEFNNI